MNCMCAAWIVTLKIIFSQSDKLPNEKEEMFVKKWFPILLDRNITGLAKQEGLNKESFICLMNHIGNKLFIELCLAVFVRNFHLY